MLTKIQKKRKRKNQKSEVGLEPGPHWWQSVTLTIKLTGLYWNDLKPYIMRRPTGGAGDNPDYFHS